MVRSVAVVLGSYALSVVLVLCSDLLLLRLFPDDFAKGRIPSSPALAASSAAFFVVSVVSAFACARFALRNSGSHVLWLFGVGEVMGAFFTLANWSKGWPHWYFVSWMVLWPVSCFLGLKFGERNDSVSATAA